MPDTKKSILQSNHRSETLYSGFVTVVTHKTIVVSSRHSMSRWMSSVTRMHPSRTVLSQK